VLVRFDEIPEAGLWLNVTEASWVPADEFTVHGPVAVTIFLEKNGERVLLSGTMKICILQKCDRCLASFPFELDTRFNVDLEYSVEASAKDLGSDHACVPEEMDVVQLEEPVIDVYSLLLQQLYLGMPDKLLCSEGCLGICSSCGADLNASACECSKEAGSSPFSVLAKLKR